MDIVNPQVLEHQRDLGATAGGFPMSELLANHLSKNDHHPNGMGDSMEDTNDMGGEVTEGMNSLVVATPAKKETKPKNPRKTPAKKEAASENGEPNGEAATPKVKKPGRTPGKKAKADAENGVPATPEAKPRKPRTPKAKKDTPVKAEGSGNNEAQAEPQTPEPVMNEPKAKSSGKKRGAKEADDGEVAETPTKKPRKTPTKAASSSGAVVTSTPAKKPRARADKFPESREEFSAVDNLIVDMKNDGKSWEEINKAYADLVGKEATKDYLRKRCPKLLAVIQEWTEDDAKRLAIAKRQIQDEHAKSIKNFEHEKWGKIALAIKDAGGNEYKAPAVQKKWEKMEKQGDVDATGNYIKVENNASTNGENGDSSADAEVSDDGQAEQVDGAEEGDDDQEMDEA